MAIIDAMSLARRLIRTFAAAALALAPLPACSDDTVDPPVAGDTDELPEDLGGPARGLSIVSVELNQGTGVEVIRDGEPVPADARNARMIRDRDTLVRVTHQIDDPDRWVTRELTGILHIETPAGAELIKTRTFTVAADSDPRKLTSAFYFGVLADEAQPGSKFWIELREADASLELPELAAGRSETPVAAFGFDAAALELRVVLVPVRYEHLDPPREPDITSEDLALFHDLLLQQNPVQTVDLLVRDQPIVWTEQLTSLGSLLSPTREAKLDDGAGPNVYYHALVDVGGPSVSSVAGIATLTDASQADGVNRIAVTVYHKHVSVPDPDEEDQTPTVFPPINSARTFVHEIGHNQGLRHVACPNANAAGPDPEYPHADGKIGVHGFGIRDFHMYTPTASHDYMSYCGNSWVSDWTWNKTYARIETLTAWDAGLAASPGPATGPILVGLLGPDGFEDWSVSVGAIPAGAASSSDAIEYSVDGAVAARVPARVELLSDDATLMLSAPLPLAAAALDGVAWIRGRDRRAIEAAQIRRR